MQYYCGIIGIGILGTHVYGYPCVGIRSSVFSVYGVRYMVYSYVSDVLARVEYRFGMSKVNAGRCFIFHQLWKPFSRVC